MVLPVLTVSIPDLTVGVPVLTGITTVSTVSQAVTFEDSYVMTVQAIVSINVSTKNTLQTTVTFLFVAIYKSVYTDNRY